MGLAALIAGMAFLLGGCDTIMGWLDNPPVVSPTVSGSPLVGDTMTGSYSWTDSDAEGASTYQWYRASDSTGTGAAVISGATGKTYLMTDDVVGKYLCFEVTPNASTGNKTGTATRSAYTTAAVISVAMRNDAYKSMYLCYCTLILASMSTNTSGTGWSLSTTTTSNGASYAMTYAAIPYNTVLGAFSPSWTNTADADATVTGTLTVTYVGASLSTATSISFVSDTLAIGNNDLGVTSAKIDATFQDTASGATGTVNVNGVERAGSEFFLYIQSPS